MGSTSSEPAGEDAAAPQTQPARGGKAGAPAPTAVVADATAAGQQQQQASVHYWYSRAHRALKQRASEPAQLMREYYHVAALDASLTHSSGVAKSRAAAGRNRYANVLPFDYNRVVLQELQAQPNTSTSTSNKPSSDYINASTVEFSSSSTPTCRYIATQGPLPGTTCDFWAMVLQLQVPAVLMLTNVCEAGVVKCSQYFPDTPHSVSRVGGLELKVVEQQPFGDDCTLRTLQVSCAATGAAHRLSHYHFHAWPDHGTPDSSSGIRAMCRALAPARATGRPIVVHCSAGIGRTGTFCAIDILLQRLDAWASAGAAGPDRAEVEDTLDVPALVHKLRAQRMGMVQTLEQYVFVYKALLDELAACIKGSSGSGSGSSSGSSSGDNAVNGSGSSHAL